MAKISGKINVDLNTPSRFRKCRKTLNRYAVRFTQRLAGDTLSIGGGITLCIVRAMQFMRHNLVASNGIDRLSLICKSPISMFPCTFEKRGFSLEHDIICGQNATMTTQRRQYCNAGCPKKAPSTEMKLLMEFECMINALVSERHGS